MSQHIAAGAGRASVGVMARPWHRGVFGRWVSPETHLAPRIAGIRTALLALVVLLLSTAMWGVGELDERGLTTEPQDAFLTVAAVTAVSLLGHWLDRRIVSPLVRAQDAALLRIIAEQRSVRLALERELATKQVFIDQANHHLRTPVTVIYGVSEILTDHGEGLAPEVRLELGQSVLRHASVLRDVVDDLSGFLAREVAHASGHRQPGSTSN